MKRHPIILPAVFLLVLGRASHAEVWHVPGDFTTIQEAIDDSSVIDGDTILVGPGYFAGALLTKSVEIKGLGGAIIDSGPLHSSGLIQGFRLLDGSGGTTLSQLTFTVELAIMNGEAVNDVTVTQCTFYDSIQAVSNWRGSQWDISHNKIFDNAIGFNDLRGTDFTIEMTPVELADYNDISRNLGADPNRGHGLHPVVFGPGGN